MKKLSFAIIALVGFMLMTGCKKDPAPTPEPDADLYTDGEEIVTKDEDAGKWTYRSSTLAIDITRYTGKVNKMELTTQ